MSLSRSESEQFFRLYFSVIVRANEDLGLVQGLRTSEEARSIDYHLKCKIRDHLFDHPEIFDEYLLERSPRMRKGDIEMVAAWRRHFLISDFLIVRHMQRYSVFIDPRRPPRAYAVVSSGRPFPVSLGNELPRIGRTVLLPYKGRIIYDGLLSIYILKIDMKMRREFDQYYRILRESPGIITSLPYGEETTTSEDG